MIQLHVQHSLWQKPRQPAEAELRQGCPGKTASHGPVNAEGVSTAATRHTMLAMQLRVQEHKFDDVQFVGRGGFGEVYKAWHRTR